MLSAAHSLDPFRVLEGGFALLVVGRAVAVRETDDEPLTLVPIVDPVMAREEAVDR